MLCISIKSLPGQMRSSCCTSNPLLRGSSDGGGVLLLCDSTSLALMFLHTISEYLMMSIVRINVRSCTMMNIVWRLNEPILMRQGPMSTMIRNSLAPAPRMRWTAWVIRMVFLPYLTLDIVEQQGTLEQTRQHSLKLQKLMRYILNLLHGDWMLVLRPCFLQKMRQQLMKNTFDRICSTMMNITRILYLTSSFSTTKHARVRGISEAHRRRYTIFSTKKGILRIIRVRRQYTPRIMSENWLMKFLRDCRNELELLTTVSGTTGGSAFLVHKQAPVKLQYESSLRSFMDRFVYPWYVMFCCSNNGGRVLLQRNVEETLKLQLTVASSEKLKVKARVCATELFLFAKMEKLLNSSLLHAVIFLTASERFILVKTRLLPESQQNGAQLVTSIAIVEMFSNVRVAWYQLLAKSWQMKVQYITQVEAHPN